MTASLLAAVTLVTGGVPKENWRFISAEGFRTNAPAVAAAFSRDVVNAADVTKAEAFVTSLGCFELYVNGKLVSVSSDGNRADFLRPGYTDRVKRRVSLGYDVTDLWKTGAGVTNGLSAFVAQTWFGDRIGRNLWMKEMLPPSLAAQIRLTYADGKTAVVETDGRWCASFATPFVRAGVYEGETYDARSNACARVCAGSRHAVVEDRSKAAVTPFVGANVSLREDLTLRPVLAYVYAGAEGAVSTNAYGRVKVLRRYSSGQAMTLAKGETLVVDFGQNAAAVPEIVASAARGTILRFKGAEMLNDANGEKSRGCDGPAGSPYFANYSWCESWDKASVAYVFAGSGEERYRPTFTFMGYRYGVLTATDDVTIRSVASVPVSSISKASERGTLKTGDASVNRLISNIRWGQRSNYLSVPSDCPQRAERLGWSADTQIFAAAAFYNADVCDFLRKWTGDMRDGQSATGAYPSFAPGRGNGIEFGWDDAGVLVPWTAWRMTGRTEIINENWEAMNRYLDAVAADNAVYPGTWTFADWLSFEKWESNSAACLEYNDGKGNCWPWPGAKRMWDFLYGCYWLIDAEKMAEMAVATGRDPARYRKMAERARNRLKFGFFEADGGLLKDFRDMQTPTLFALKTGLYRDEQAKKSAVEGLMANFRENGNRLKTGFLGTSILMDALTSDAGRPDMAYTLLLQHEFPSWLYSVDQGATTVWERWNSYTKKDGFGPVSMNSFNHYAYGSVLAWMYGTMAGIQPGPKGGFDGEFRLAPVPDARMGFVEATYPTRNGVIRSAWRYENGRCLWSFTVPEGSKAAVAANGTEKVYGGGNYVLEIGRTPPATCAEADFPVARAEYAKYCRLITGGEGPKASFAVDGALDARHDEYRIVSADGGVRFVGASARAVLYAVYDFLERRGGCAWFWDGDVVPKRPSIDVSGLDVREKARFEYRGLRYFAHRSLTRFQAEQWTLDDWKREIDWCCKRRLNLMMLRIGQDDLFARAFPDVVPYPKGYEGVSATPRSYDDRTLFWDMKTRSEIRRGVVAYACERGMDVPVDTGTMSHWYSRTPQSFLDKMKPDFIPQASEGYSQQSGLVWDIRRDKWLDAYWKLTQAEIDAYFGGEARLFHTIGLGERVCYRDRAKNHDFKLYANRRIIDKLREHYPQAPLLVASWDFISTWSPAEVRSFVKTLDPTNTIILDYTSDIWDNDDNFQNWDLLGKFPWIYGIFHAYEASNEIRGNYATIRQRFPKAAEDPMCKGVVFWPEMSHGDPLMIDYFPSIGWDPSVYEINDYLPGFCRRRYGARDAERRLGLWRRFLPLAEASRWGTQVGNGYRFNPVREFYPDVYFNLHGWFYGDDPKNAALHAEYYVFEERTLGPLVANAVDTLNALAREDFAKLDVMTRRDLLDIARTTLARMIELQMARIGRVWNEYVFGGEPDAVRRELAKTRALGQALTKVLESSDEFSLNASLAKMHRHRTNPDFEKTLKGNAANVYCRSYVYELAREVYEPTFAAFADWAERHLAAGNRSRLNGTAAEQDALFDPILDAFYAKPLSEMRPNAAEALGRLPDVLRTAAKTLGEGAEK